MNSLSPPVSSDHLNRYARRGLIAALVLTLLLGGCAALINLEPRGVLAHRAGQLLVLLPLIIIFAIVWVRAALPRGQRRISNDQIRSVMQDELRQDSLHKAFRVALVDLLLSQPLFGIALTLLPVAGAPLLMAAATVIVGTALFFATLLLCDRD